ncbi:MAG TPA: response regulator transcription factor [Opitutaceae bacterium]|nr:response regulator transcription factor [Opitutaceae bacterium]
MAAERPAPPIRVAVVEDDPDVRALLCQWLREEPGFECVCEAPNAEVAFAKLPDLKPDVVLHDIVLPGKSGIESVARLKPLLPQTQFVMLTVYEDVEHIFAALSAGATGYMLKRTPRPALVEALREVHAGGSPMSTSIARKVVQSLHQPRRPATSAATEGLSARENQVLELLARGHLYKEIADEIGISVPTVNTYIRRIYEKLHVRSRAQAVAVYANLGGPAGRPPGAA